MAYKLDKSALQTLFEGIRDERRLQANTANRIGNAFLSLLHFCADETSEAFLSRKHDDAAEGMITFLRGLISEQMAQLKAGAQFGDFVSGLYNGKGAQVDANGNAEVESITIRTYMRVMELIVNRLSAQEGDTFFTESDTIESVDSLGDDCYGLHLRSKYSGYFTAQHVGNVIKGGPAEKMGLLAGDKIVEVDGKPFVGQVVTDTEARRRLMGPKGTKVEVGVVRYGTKAVKRFTITRADIVTPSIAATYMLNDSTGYIRIKSFGQKTYMEMLASLASLSQQGFSSLIIDLRDNNGGYLESAIQMADEFLPKDRLIVYTQGRKSPRRDYRSSGRGAYQTIPLVVLINEASASSAEIFAGAIQDNDRGTIVGRRSFGKGLVQQQIGFPDGSEIRLTIARYYTPSGRCIQKPYKLGDEADYDQDLLQRYERGELFSGDSIHHTGPAYHTTLGRPVYGGGGITPDIFVAEDTTDITSYYKQAVMSGLILQFAFNYTDANRPHLRTLTEVIDLANYLQGQGLVDQFATFGTHNGLPRRNLMIRRSYHLLDRFISSRVIYNMLDEQALMEYLNQDDPVVEAAIGVIKRHEAFPKKAAAAKPRRATSEMEPRR